MSAKPPIFDAKHHASPAVFRPENLLRESRRQRRLPELPVPKICILDPDGDIVRALRTDGRDRVFAGWACYHTEMLTFEQEGPVPNSHVTSRHLGSGEDTAVGNGPKPNQRNELADRVTEA